MDARLGKPAVLARDQSRGSAVRLGTGLGSPLARRPANSPQRARSRSLPARSESAPRSNPATTFSPTGRLPIFRSDGNLLRFTSAVETPYPENNRVHGQWFPARHKPGSRRVAALVLPHWNASADAAQRPVRGTRQAGDLRAAAQHAVSRLPHAGRAGARRLRGFLERRPHHRRDAAGRDRHAKLRRLAGLARATSASAWWAPAWVPATRFWPASHDPRIEVNVFNHCSTYFADVVWEGPFVAAHPQGSGIG